MDLLRTTMVVGCLFLAVKWVVKALHMSIHEYMILFGRDLYPTLVDSVRVNAKSLHFTSLLV